MKFTCFAVGMAVHQNPYVVDAVQAYGSEVASHNHRWIDYATLTPAQESQHINACIDELESASSMGLVSTFDIVGKGPVGWYTGRVSLNSRRLVWEAYVQRDLELLYESDAYNDDLPYWVDMPDDKGLLILPYTLDVNDMKFAVAPGFTDPDAFYRYLVNAFDVLREEGGKMMSVGLHCRLIGAE